MTVASDFQFYFCIPLISKTASHNWAAVCNNLNRTLTNLLSQTEKRFRIMIAGHECPQFILEKAEIAAQVEFISVADMFPPPLEISHLGRDKARKKRVMGVRFHKLGIPRTYVMFLDADDLVHKNLVSITRHLDNRRGYYFTSGYMYDVQHKLLALNQNEFYKTCGSSAIIHFSKSDFPANRRDRDCYFSRFQDHRFFVEVARSFGRPLDELRSPFVVYMLNHGENLQHLEGKISAKIRKIRQYSIASTNELRKYDKLFPGLTD